MRLDWWENVNFDLLPVIKGDSKLKVDVLDPSAQVAMLRMNQLHPPFNNPAIRRALLGAVNQSDFMTAVAGTDKQWWKDGIGYFPPISKMASDVGMGALLGPRDYAKAKQEIVAAGYKGEPIVVMVASDYPTLNAMALVGVDMLRKVGFNVDMVETDWGSVVQRRASRNAPDKGGWSVFFTNFTGLDESTPAGHLGLRGNGEAAWFGWPTAPKLEELRNTWFEAPDLPAQLAVAKQIQAEAFREVPYVPLGEYLQPTGYTTSLKGLLPGHADFLERGTGVSMFSVWHIASFQRGTNLGRYRWHTGHGSSPRQSSQGYEYALQPASVEVRSAPRTRSASRPEKLHRSWRWWSRVERNGSNAVGRLSLKS